MILLKQQRKDTRNILHYIQFHPKQKQFYQLTHLKETESRTKAEPIDSVASTASLGVCYEKSTESLDSLPQKEALGKMHKVWRKDIMASSHIINQSLVFKF